MRWGTTIAIGAALAVLGTSVPASPAGAAAPFASAADVISSTTVADARVGRAPSNMIAPRLVRLQTSMLTTRRTGTRLRFDIGRGLRFTGKVTRIERQMGMPAWSGVLDGRAGWFTIARSGTTFNIQLNTVAAGRIEVSQARGSVYRVARIKRPARLEPAKMPVARTHASARPGSTRADSSASFDVMVAYSNQAAAAETLAALKARVAAGVADSNTAYVNSGINTRMRLVHLEPARYSDSGDVTTDLYRLTNTSDGYMDQLPGIRDTFGADVMMLMVDSPLSGTIGVAWVNPGADSAFGVMVRGWVGPSEVLPHEVGHIQGLAHDVATEPTVPSFYTYDYGRGYVDSTNGFSTIMSYAPSWAPIIPYFSTLAKTYNGHALGNATARSVEVANLTAATVANYRTIRVANGLTSQFNGTHAGWETVSGGWIQRATDYATNGVANGPASIRSTTVYGDVTFTARVMRSGADVSSPNRLIVRGNRASIVGGWMRPSYLLQWNNGGRFSVIQVTSTGALTVVVPWTSSAAIVKGSAWNTIKVVAVGSILRFFINNVQVATLANAFLAVGSVGVGYSRSAVPAALFVDWATVATSPAAPDTR